MKLNILERNLLNLNNTKNSSFIGYKQMLRPRLETFFSLVLSKDTAKNHIWRKKYKTKLVLCKL